MLKNNDGKEQEVEVDADAGEQPWIWIQINEVVKVSLVVTVFCINLLIFFFSPLIIFSTNVKIPQLYTEVEAAGDSGWTECCTD